MGKKELFYPKVVKIELVRFFNFLAGRHVLLGRRTCRGIFRFIFFFLVDSNQSLLD